MLVGADIRWWLGYCEGLGGAVEGEFAVQGAC